MLVSTASPHTLVPLAGDACSSAVFGTVPPSCAVSRGKLYEVNNSSSWVDVGLYGINENGVGLEANLGYEARVQFGLEHLGIGLNGPGFENRTVGLIAAPQPFYLSVSQRDKSSSMLTLSFQRNLWAQWPTRQLYVSRKPVDPIVLHDAQGPKENPKLELELHGRRKIP